MAKKPTAADGPQLDDLALSRDWDIPEADPAIEREIFLSVFPDAPAPASEEEKGPRYQAIPTPGGAPKGTRAGNQEHDGAVLQEWKKYRAAHPEPNIAAFVRMLRKLYPDLTLTYEIVRGILRDREELAPPA